MAMVLVGLLAVSPGPVEAQTLAAQPFSAYGTGDAIALNALSLGASTLAGTRIAASGGSVNSGPAGLTTPITNEFGQNVQPATPGKNAYGRGTAVEAGVLTATPQPVDINQIIASGLAQAFAPPPSPLVTTAITIPVNPLLYASTAGGEAKATFDPAFCPIGRPLSYGRGFVENLQLLGTTQAANGSISDPLLGTSVSTGNPRATTQSRTVTYLVANGDGTFGVATETRQTVAPITVAALGGLGGLQIEIAGEFGFRVVATGKPGGASAGYTGNPLLTISTVTAGVVTPIVGPVSLQSITGPERHHHPGRPGRPAEPVARGPAPGPGRGQRHHGNPGLERHLGLGCGGPPPPPGPGQHARPRAGPHGGRRVGARRRHQVQPPDQQDGQRRPGDGGPELHLHHQDPE